MSSPTQRLADLGLQLPTVPAPVADYVPAVVHGGLVWTSGQLPLSQGELLATGVVGAQVSAELAAECARLAALNALAAAAAAAGGLDALARVVKVVGFVASAPGFTAQPAVVNGASGLLGSVFPGGHARSAVGVAALPLGAPVEVEIVVALG